ncbi:MAG: hypothetical protein K9N35_03405 [Candidatus Marinimicrobia bacterium]|nr:hypothetical protein [Candidatus Neomarinimicrobiota bacterium]
MTTSLQAHHAMEFIELESYSTAPQGAFVFHLHHDYMVDDVDQPNLDHWEMTPGMSYGITDRLMIDVHSHFAKFGTGHLVLPSLALTYPDGPSPFMEAMAFALQYKITEKGPIDMGLSLTYEEPFSRSVDLLGGQRLFGLDLIINKSFGGHRILLLNLIAEMDGDEEGYAWGLGLRTPLTPDVHGIAAGIELQGDFEGEISLLPGIYFPLGMQDIVFKTGLEFTSDGASRSNLTLMYLF